MPGGGRENETYGRFLGQALGELALAQHGVFSLHELRELGLTARAIQYRVAVGRLHRIHKTVYSLVPRPLLRREGLYMAAVLACGPGAVLSHRSAAVLHQIRDWGSSKIDVTVPGRSTCTHRDVAVHRSPTLGQQDVTVINNVPFTTLARTLLDLAEVVTHRQLEWSFDQTEIVQGLDLHAINEQLARNPTRRGAKAIKTVLTTHYIGTTRTASDNEELLLSITRPLGLPDPECNRFIALPDGRAAVKVDFVWRGQELILEADSGKWHGTRQRMEIDRRRDQRLIAAGWTVIRTTWRQMTYRPGELRETLLKLLGPASPSARARLAVAGAPAPARPRMTPAAGSTS